MIMQSKSDFLKAINNKINHGEAIIVTGVGSGLTAKGACLGGADILATYNTAVYRIYGVPTAMAFLPYDDCNKIAFDTLPQVLANSGDVPVIIGLGAHDPRRNIKQMVLQAKKMGAAGITNEPFIGMYEGDLRKQLEAANIGFNREIEMIKTASEEEMLTLAYVYNENEAIEMAFAGADMLGVMVGGVTSGGTAGGVETVGIDSAIEITNRIGEALKVAGKTIPLLIHGGPLNDVEPVRKVINKSYAVGYVTGSTGERVPTVNAVKDKIADFSSIRKE